MRILIPFNLRDIGGPSTFARKFKTGMEARGHQVTFDERDEYDIILVIVQAPLALLRRARQKGIPIVQRLDGTYYWSVARWMFPLLNLKAALIRHLFADFTIYQSEYSRRSANCFLWPATNERHALIYNGVDLGLFSPEGPTELLRESPGQQIFFTASEFRRRDQIVPLLEGLSHYRKHYSTNCRLIVAGSFSREVFGFEERLRQYPWVTFLGKIKNVDLPRYERGSDVFLFTHLNPPCPNNVIEAMGCGLPICGIADGAMPELVKSGENGLLAPALGDAHWKQRKYDHKRFADNLAAIIKERERYATASRRRATEYFSLERMLNEYEHVLGQLI